MNLNMINRFKDIIYTMLFKEKIIISNDDDLYNKVIIITGASKGLGKNTADLLLKKGASLVLVSRNIDQLKKEYSNHPRCLIFSADIKLKQDCQRIVNSAIKAFGYIDVLINNAGIFIKEEIENITHKQLDDVIDTNIKGAFLMSAAVVPLMKKRNKGLIINIGSKISHNSQVKPGMVIYATSKYAVEGFSLSLARELLPYGIRVSCLMPGTINTFRSLQANQYLSSYKLGSVITTLIKHQDIHFESMVLKSFKENI